MNVYEEKYRAKDNKEVNPFHQGRRMFCIYNDKLYIAPANFPHSHAEWFEHEGWMTKESDGFMDEVVRGLVKDKGDIYFYIGYDFEVNDNMEAIFFSHLEELAKKLQLDNKAEIYGGLVKSTPGTIWPPIRKYGKLANNLK